jgi:hypothetical protein
VPGLIQTLIEQEADFGGLRSERNERVNSGAYRRLVGVIEVGDQAGNFVVVQIIDRQQCRRASS